MTCRAAIRRPAAADHSPAAFMPSATPLDRVLRARRRAKVGWLLCTLAALALGLASAGSAPAATADDPAQRLVEAALQDTVQLFGEAPASRAERAQRLRTLLDRYVDLPRIGRDSLGAHWRRATPEQQGAFLVLFEDLLSATYSASSSAAKVGSLRFGTPAVVERDDAVTVVRSDLQMSEGAPLPVLFMVGRSEDGAYRITDVVAAAISMSRLFSADFVAVLRSNGGQFNALIDAMAHKVSATSAP